MAVHLDVDEGEALDRLRQRFRAVSLRVSDAIPSVIYHYTSAAGLLGIITSGVFRATNFNYLNDTSEMRHGHTVVSKVIGEKELSRALSANQLRLLTATRQKLEAVVIDRHFYLSCFCTKSDILSQWRGYGSAKDRFSIGFDTERLPQRGLDYRFKRVVYKKDEQRKSVTSSIDAALALVKSDDYTNDFVEEVSGVLADKLIGDYVFFKDWAFRDEREWRAVTVRHPDAKQVAFDVAAGSIRPFVNLWKGEPHPNRPKVRLLPISSVTAFNKRSKLAVELLLSKHGYQNVTVSTSTVPYQEL